MVFRIEQVDILKRKVRFIVPEVAAIHPLLFAVDIVGPRDTPTRLLQSETHQTNAREELGYGEVLFGNSILHGFRMSDCAFVGKCEPSRKM